MCDFSMVIGLEKMFTIRPFFNSTFCLHALCIFCCFHLTVQQWQKMMEEKLSPLFSLKEVLSEEEAVKMGRKDPEEEVEKFVSANTQELGKDKWLCPLSGKKFKVRLRRMLQ